MHPRGGVPAGARLQPWHGARPVRGGGEVVGAQEDGAAVRGELQQPRDVVVVARAVVGAEEGLGQLAAPAGRAEKERLILL